MGFSCRDVRARWEEYLYRELDEPDQGRIAQHLQRCPQCREEESQWRELLSRFDVMSVSNGDAEPPRELVFRVKRQVQLYEGWSRQMSIQFRNWVLGCATACALLFGGVWTLHSRLLTVSDPNLVFKPITGAVLNSLYAKDTLRVLVDEGLFEAEHGRKTNIAADLPDTSDLNSTPSKKPAESMSQQPS
jgi:predicted anti-sigma-YlaC factor YlaD